MRYREPFTVFPRKMDSGRIIWYYQTYDETGKRTSAFSTGQISKSAARALCFKLMKQKNLCPVKGGQMTFKQFSKDWWIWEKCEYLRYRRTRRDITKGYADSSLRISAKHIIPYFSSMKLADIKPNDIENWLQHLTENGLSTTTANNPRIPIHGTSCSYALRGALKRMGMTADEIKEKNISFHSWRHYFNTIMRSNNITDSKLQKMTGHKSTQMTDYYTHYETEDLKEIVEIQAKIVPGSI